MDGRQKKMLELADFQIRIFQDLIDDEIEFNQKYVCHYKEKQKYTLNEITDMYLTPHVSTHFEFFNVLDPFILSKKVHFMSL